MIKSKRKSQRKEAIREFAIRREAELRNPKPNLKNITGTRAVNPMRGTIQFTNTMDAEILNNSFASLPIRYSMHATGGSIRLTGEENE